MSQPESWLCSVCKRVVQPESNGLAFRNGGPAGPSLDQFRKAAADNCFICSKLWNFSRQHRQAWESLDPEEWTSFRYIVDREEYEGTLDHVKLWVIFDDPTGDKSEHTMDIRFRLIPLISSSYEKYFVFSEFQENTGCRNLPTTTKGWLPSRLLDVGAYEDMYWKLLISANDITQSPTPAYLTLSYRWGADPQYALLSSSNIDQFRRGVTFSNLPQTFKDFAVIARRFGIRYVWIDCFCIVQDSRDDWEAEAPMMRHIYANSACNIAASASGSPEGGLFRSRDGQDIQAGIVSTTLTSELPKKFYIFDKSYWDRQLLQGSLHRRGWVFQERFLGPRQLYFAKNQVLWECLEEHKCEGFPLGIPLHDSSKSIERLFSLPKNRPALGQQQITDREGHFDNIMTFDAVDLWCDLVSAYSRCCFTKSADKLYAFAGIAKLFKEVTGDRYLAGIWQSQILHMLNWTVFTPKPKHSGPYRAPSWSWASVDGLVKLRKPAAGFEFLVSVVDVDVTTKKKQDDTVDVIGGFIKLRGALFTAYYTQESTEAPLQVQLQVQMADRHICSFTVWPLQDTSEIQFENRGTIHFLVLKSQKMQHRTFGQSTTEEKTDLTCLVVAPVEGLEDIYRRTGWFFVTYEEPVFTIIAACKEEQQDILVI
ncbi:hypothetical protein EsH8_I_000548 [Colletotrichum jinshuiense]